VRLSELRPATGIPLDAYIARPDGEPIGGLVVIQEIFEVNPHIREVADSYAKHGFLAIAAALFDRIEKKIKLNFDNAMKDIDAALEWARKYSGNKKTGVIGYCAGGTLACGAR
jgi:carboxymethylenebutenolidase